MKTKVDIYLYHERNNDYLYVVIHKDDYRDVRKIVDRVYHKGYLRIFAPIDDVKKYNLTYEDYRKLKLSKSKLIGNKIKHLHILELLSILDELELVCPMYTNLREYLDSSLELALFN